MECFIFEMGRTNKTQLIGLKAFGRWRWCVECLLLQALCFESLFLTNPLLGDSVVNTGSHAAVPYPSAYLFRLMTVLPSTSTTMPDRVIVPSLFMTSLLAPTSRVMDVAALIFTSPLSTVT
ncbi:hypothetical protein D3C80_1742510 [compost metagenome]